MHITFSLLDLGQRSPKIRVPRWPSPEQISPNDQTLIPLLGTPTFDKQDSRLGRCKRAIKLCAATAVKHVDDVEDERVPSLINISKISPVAYLPSLQVNKTHATDLETSSENSQKLQEGWIFVGRNREKRKELISHHNIDRTIVLPSESSLDLAKTAGRKTKAEKAVLSSESSFIDWLKPKITLCGKVVGVSVGNNQEDWKRLIEFAQGRERLNSKAKEEERSKKRTTRELRSLKSSINY
ncbi:hypothetical protein AAC387_Pa08g1096 [Persea americana]